MRTPHKRIVVPLAVVVTATIAAIVLLPLIPDYLEDPSLRDNFLPITPGYVAIFGVFSAVMIGLFAGIHRLISGEYGRIQRRRSLWFFIPFATVFGVVLGEAANPVMLIPYGAFMTAYGFLYRRFDWRVVAISAYLGGMLIENAMNRSPLQAPTLMWVAFFIVPYFATRAWEDRHRVGYRKLARAVVPLVAASVALAFAAWQGGKAASDTGEGSPPLVVFAAALPFILVVPYLLAARAGWFGRAHGVPWPVPVWTMPPLFAVSAALAWLAWLMTSETGEGRTSPPLIVVGAMLPFLIAIPVTLLKRRRATA